MRNNSQQLGGNCMTLKAVTVDATPLRISPNLHPRGLCGPWVCHQEQPTSTILRNSLNINIHLRTTSSSCSPINL